MSKLNVPPGVRCNDPNCHNCNHHDDLDDFCNSIVITLKRCGHTLRSNRKGAYKYNVVPGWNERVKELHCAARDAYCIWKEIGKPRQGDIFNVMKLSRMKFKQAIRKCKREKETIIADNIAEQLCQKDHRKFWKEIKHCTNSKVKLPTNIDNIHGDVNIGSMWKHHYEHLFNDVEDSRCDKVCYDCSTDNTGMTVGAVELMDIINGLSKNKSPVRYQCRTY